MTLPPNLDLGRVVIIFFGAVIGFVALFRGDFIASVLFFAMAALVAFKAWRAR